MSPATGWMWFQKAYPIRITNHSSGRSELSCKQTFVDTDLPFPKILSTDQTNSANFIKIHRNSSKFIVRKSVLPGKCLLCREADGDICNGSEGEWRHEDARAFIGIDGIHGDTWGLLLCINRYMYYVMYIIHIYIYIYTCNGTLFLCLVNMAALFISPSRAQGMM